MEKPWTTHWTVAAPGPEGDLTASIGPAQRHPEQTTVWCCPVLIPSRFKTEKLIAGVDEAQAHELAVWFAKDMLAHQGADLEKAEVLPL